MLESVDLRFDLQKSKLNVELSHEEILGELLVLDAARVARRGFERESAVEQTRDDLDGVELAVAVEREADDLAALELVPSDA